VIDKTDEVDYYIRLAKMAQESNNVDYGMRILISMKEALRGKGACKINEMARVEFAILQNTFNMGKGAQVEAISKLQRLLNQKDDLKNTFRSECYLKLAQWLYDS